MNERLYMYIHMNILNYVSSLKPQEDLITVPTGRPGLFFTVYCSFKVKRHFTSYRKSAYYILGRAQKVGLRMRFFALPWTMVVRS